MSAPMKLSFYKTNDHNSYKSALEAKAVYSVLLEYGEAHKGFEQGAVYDAIELINETKRCFGIEEPLKYVLIDGDKIIDFD